MSEPKEFGKLVLRSSWEQYPEEHKMMFRREIETHFPEYEISEIEARYPNSLFEEDITVMLTATGKKKWQSDS